MTNDKPPRIVYAKPPRRARRKAPPGRGDNSRRHRDSKEASKVDAAIRYARMLQKPEEP